MSLVHEIHKQRSAVRHTLFFFSAVIVISFIAFTTVSSFQKDIFFAMNPDTATQQEYLVERDEKRPNPLSAIARFAGSLTASIGSLIGWNRDAGFDRGGQQDTMQGGVHLLPVSE